MQMNGRKREKTKLRKQESYVMKEKMEFLTLAMHYRGQAKNLCTNELTLIAVVHNNKLRILNKILEETLPS